MKYSVQSYAKGHLRTVFVAATTLNFLLLTFSLWAAGQAPLALKDAFKGSFLVGAALNPREFSESDARDAALVKAQFDAISPENVLKWQSVHPQPDRYDFDLSDQYVAFGEKNHMFIVGHTLVWHHQTPRWVFEDAKGNPVDRETLLKRMREHIQTVVGRYKGRVNGWDVVNEALNDDGTLSQTAWLKIIGEDYIAKAFEFAHEADPEAQLQYNDFSLENEAKRNGAIELIKKLRAQGVPITGVGLQGHYGMDWPSVDQLDATIAAFAQLGVKVMITELDVDVLPPAWQYHGADIWANAELQPKLNPYTNGLPDSVQQTLAKRYADLFGVFFKHRGDLTRVTFWGVTDASSWLNNWPVRGRTNYPLLFDREGRAKPAFDAVIEVARRAPASTLMTAAFAQGKAPLPAYQDPSLPLEKRVEDLVSRMTLEEKISQMRDHAVAIPRLSVPKYDWWNEGLHGVAFAGYATNFPQVIGMAATWDTDLVHRMGETVSTEARAKYNEAMRHDDRETFFGLTFWAPNINIFRDPRWGRGQETYGEDPFLTSRMGVAFASGMQGSDSKYFRVVSTPKHYAVHSGPEPLRHGFNVDVSPHDLEDTYLPAFRATVTEAHAQSVMCAFNAIDGAPACASTTLLRDHLREAWKFDGYVVSDCAAVADIFNGHHYSADMPHAAAAAVKAGTDLECGYAEGQAFPSLLDAVHQGLIKEADLDTALRRLFRARFKLGMFDPPSSFPYGQIPASEVNSPEHRQLSLRAARESIVLLKNQGHTLPLEARIARIAVVGPTAELVQSLQGNYNGPPPSPVYPLAGIEKRFSSAKVAYAQGSTLVEGLAVPIEHTALHPARGSGDGLTGEYFSSPDLSGAPVLTRTDRNVNFNWDKVVPVKGLTRNNYSVRWSGSFTPPAPGEYRLGVRANYCYACENQEGFRLYLDGKLLVESGGQTTGERGAVIEAPVSFSDAKPHPIRLEYFHTTGTAGIDLTWQAPAAVLRDEAVEAAKESEVTIAFVGLSPSLEGEEMPVKLAGFSGGDRTSIDLPAPQEDLLKALAGTGKPLVVVLQNGSALAVNWAQEHAAAVLEAWYPGEEGGTAIAETLGDANNPGGRLPVTFYASLDQVPPFEDYSMHDRTYRYFQGKPLYGFGYGLSYATFEYSNLRLSSPQLKAGDELTVEADVRNASGPAGDEVAELYLEFPPEPGAPLRALRGFQRLHLAPGETRHVTYTLKARDLSMVNEKGEHVVAPGEYNVFVGGAQPGDTPAGVRARLEITGEFNLPR